MRIGIYPGTFDPITNGHLDIIKRGLHLFDKLYIVVPKNIQKNALFTTNERVELLQEVLKDYSNIEVVSTDELTVNFAEKVQATVMLRGLRMVSDFEYELQMATLNRHLNNKIETIFDIIVNKDLIKDYNISKNTVVDLMLYTTIYNYDNKKYFSRYGNVISLNLIILSTFSFISSIVNSLLRAAW